MPAIKDDSSSHSVKEDQSEEVEKWKKKAEKAKKKKKKLKDELEDVQEEITKLRAANKELDQTR